MVAKQLKWGEKGKLRLCGCEARTLLNFQMTEMRKIRDTDYVTATPIMWAGCFFMAAFTGSLVFIDLAALFTVIFFILWCITDVDNPL